MRVRVNGAWEDVGAGQVRVGGQWRTLVEARAYVSGEWKTIASFLPDLTVSISPDVVNAVSTVGGPILTNPATATPDGGKGPFTYSWTRVGSGIATAQSPTSATTRFARTVGLGTNVTETFRVTVTDSLGATATADKNVTFVGLFLDV